jgi:hypothetical protein
MFYTRVRITPNLQHAVHHPAPNAAKSHPVAVLCGVERCVSAGRIRASYAANRWPCSVDRIECHVCNDSARALLGHRHALTGHSFGLHRSICTSARIPGNARIQCRCYLRFPVTSAFAPDDDMSPYNVASQARRRACECAEHCDICGDRHEIVAGREPNTRLTHFPLAPLPARSP